jgi:predicted DCC family thiol-disulfide oxidoreductase YuxK
VFLDRRNELAFLPLRDPEAASLLDGLGEEERFATWRLAQLDGSLVGYGAGGVQLFEAMRVTRPVGRVLAYVPAAILERIYDVVARSRGTLGRLVPDRPGPRRFP